MPTSNDGIMVILSSPSGVGKTTLTKLLAKHYRWQAHYEEVLENPYLDDFYHEMERWSFNLQIYFLYNRFSQILDIQKSGKKISRFLRRILQKRKRK